MTIVNSRFPGIGIDQPDGVATFTAIVNEALDRLSQRPVGNRLLQLAAAEAPARGAAAFGGNVWLIRRSHYPGTRELRWNEDDGWNSAARCVRASEHQAARNGTVSRVEWNPNIITTPDGHRPNFIGLAHELIHAYRNLKGDAWLTRRDEELQTVGLQGYYEVSENKIRLEWGIPIRRAYSGL